MCLFGDLSDVFFWGGRPFGWWFFVANLVMRLGKKRGAHPHLYFFLSRGEQILVGRNEEKKV